MGSKKIAEQQEVTRRMATPPPPRSWSQSSNKYNDRIWGSLLNHWDLVRRDPQLKPSIQGMAGLVKAQDVLGKDVLLVER